MKRDVVVTKHAQWRIRQITDWFRRQSEVAAADWYDGVIDAILSLETDPERCELIPEHDLFQFSVPLRHLLYGCGREKTHRIIFVVRPDKVVVHEIRHMAQRELTPDDF